MISIRDKTTALEILGDQVKYIKLQAADKVPAEYTKVRCSCLKLVHWSYAYRCLYCSVFFCKSCAEDHFGKTVEQYRAEQSA